MTAHSFLLTRFTPPEDAERCITIYSLPFPAQKIISKIEIKGFSLNYVYTFVYL